MCSLLDSFQSGMDLVGVSTAPRGHAPSAHYGTDNGHAPSGSSVTPNNQKQSRKLQQQQTPSTPNKHVNFGSGQSDEKKREKFLTAKYGAHQMALIRKRLRVEMWMYERLQEMYGAVSESASRCSRRFLPGQELLYRVYNLW